MGWMKSDMAQVAWVDMHRFKTDRLPMAHGMSIVHVSTEDDLAAVTALFHAYEDSLDVDLGYQNFEAELAELPGKYAPPGGRLLIARDGDRAAVGCVALRPMTRPGCCEMKRLYVAPEGRGTGLGRALMDRLISEARGIGYSEMWLDTLPTMAAAQSLYQSAGFEPADAYYDTPVEGTVFMRLQLSSDHDG